MIDICMLRPMYNKAGGWGDGAVVFALNSSVGREWETGLLVGTQVHGSWIGQSTGGR